MQEDTPVNNEQPEQPENGVSVTPLENTQDQRPPVRDVSFAGQSPNHVLPAQKYKLKVLLLFSDFLAILACIYFFMIRDMVSDISSGDFSFVSNRMFAFYAVLAVTIGLTIVILVFKMTRSASTRFIRENQVRMDPNTKVWLVGYDWGWPVLFIPTAVLMVLAGVIGLALEVVLTDTSAVNAILGGVVILFATINAAVVIFKISPLVLGLIAGSMFVSLLIMLLYGPGTLMGFFRGFRLLGVQIEPMGFILLAYIWSIFLRIIWRCRGP
jgi:hypothetical protein